MCVPEKPLIDWLLSDENPAARYLTARDLVRPRPPDRTLRVLRGEMLAWEPLRRLLALQAEDGTFRSGREAAPAATYVALRLMSRCGMDARDAPVCG